METASNIKLTPIHRDADLSDRKGEIWQDVPGLDGYYHISNFGRVKRLEREIFDSQGGAYLLASRIIIPSINFSPNKITGDRTHRLQVSLQVSNKKRTFMVHRLVYNCFVKEFALDDLSLNVIPKNGNGFDVRPDNLLLLPIQARCKRIYKKGRLLSPSSLDPQNIVRAVKASTAVTSLEISHYDEKGKLIATFPSIMDACRKIGISHSSITSAIHRSVSAKAGGYFWRYGHRKIINMAEISTAVEQKKESYRSKKGKKVSQYNPKNKFIASYETITDAAFATHISHKTLTSHLKGNVRLAGGFIWKWS